jgi:uncharacterized protein with HEPN domain
MPPEAKKLLADMLEAADAIAQFAAGKSLAEFKSNSLLRSAIYYQYVIIGEALSQLRTHYPLVADQISEHHRIVGFRNQIIHGYAKVDHEITWRIVETKLPVLRNELAALLNLP